MPADTRSSRKAKHDDAENATALQKSTIEDSSSPSSKRKSERLKSGNSQAPIPSPIRRSERAKGTPHSGQSEKSSSLMGGIHSSSNKRKRPDNEMGIEANQVGQRGKTESNSITQTKKILPAHRYRDLFKPRKKAAKASDSAKGSRLGPCTSSNSGGSTKEIPVAEDDGLHEEEGKCAEDYAESTSKGDQGGLDFDLEVESGTAKLQSSGESHPGQKPLNDSVEVCSESETRAHMDISQNADVNIEERYLRQDAQMDNLENKCIICKLAGKLLSCGGKGCGRRCHPACINSQWKDVYPGTWHCPCCTKNKIQSGVHSVSDGIESIWDVRVENVQNYEGAKRQKEYFVKYIGLAHVHNCWLPEQQLLQEAPELVAEFVQRKTATKWRQEWSMPHRLLQKRSLMLPRSDGCGAQEVGSINCQHEWLVKWRGLDYNEITWELENAVFFEKALGLMNEYERRHEKARRSSLSQEVDEKQEKRKDISVKLTALPFGCDTSHMIFVNKLCDFWSRGQSVLINDEQVQVAHIIYFITTLQSNVSRPFLVIAPSSSISKWEAEFSIVAPSINVVVYSGNRDVRDMIRMLEFYEDGPHAMFEVLLSTADIITEDLEFIKRIRWEAIIMDECHKSDILAESLFVKEFASGSMILLWMDQKNENMIDYCKVLSLLKCNHESSDIEGRQVASNSSIAILREKLSPFIVNGPKSGSSVFVEYWVPVQMSNVQLEQYCSSLLTNLTALCSKNDPNGFLRDILISARKCCDHPYVVDRTLQAHLIEDLTPTLQGSSNGKLTISDILLDIGVKASGKLYLLDAILTKMKDQGQKVIILFKSLGGAGRDFLGDILDDFIQLRFGENSYERVDGGGLPSRNKASVTKFNEEKGRFIFLLETRACSQSIKLSSVDAVVIFGSDWNPLNDLKALQKIKMDSKLEINVFRLYTLCTIEEKVLLLSKRSNLLEGSLQGINFSTSQMLLTWGASYLFRKLDEFHNCEGTPEILPQNSIMKDVLPEFMSLLQYHGTSTSTKFISSAWQNGGSYSKDVSLFGEQCSDLKDEEPTRAFWAKLLEGRQPRWRYLSLPSQRNRKRVQYYDGTPAKNVQTDEAIKRQKKIGNTNGESRSPRVCKDVGKEPGLFRTSTRNEPQLSPGSGCETASALKSQATISLELLEQQKSLHQVLKPEMEKLFQTLGLKEDVQKMAERFLVYMITNHRVIREPDTALQAFQISVCWIAASITSEELDHVESLSLAREHLKFNCDNEDAEYVFSKMQFSRTMFLRSEGVYLQASSKNQVLGTRRLASEAMNDNVRESTVCIQQKEKASEGLDEQVLAPIQTIERTEEVKKYAKKIRKICEKEVASHIEKHMRDVEEAKELFQKKRAERENKYKHKYDIICKINSSEADKSEKLKILVAKNRQKLDQLESDLDTTLKDKEARHLADLKEVVKEADRKMERYASCIKSGLSDRLQSKETIEECGVENSGSAEGAAVSVDRERVITDNDATSNSPLTTTQINHEATTSANIAEKTAPDNVGVQGIHVSSAVTTDEVEQTATSKNDQPPSTENPVLQVDANEEGTAASDRYTVSRTEQLDEASSSTHNESTDSPATMKPSVAQPITSQHQVDSVPAYQEHEISGARLNQSNNQHVRVETSGIQNTIIQDMMPSSDNSVGVPCNASDQAVRSLPHEQAVPLATTASHSENQRPLNRSVEMTPRPSLDVSFSPSSHNSPQLENYMASRSLPAPLPASYLSQDPGKEFDPLQREYERISGELNQVSKTHEDMASRLKLECDKEIEEITAQIRRKYASMLQEAEPSLLPKKNELEHYQRKVVMNIALAEAFRSKCMSIDHRGAQQVPSNLTQQLLQSQFTRRPGSPATIGPQTTSAPPTQNANHSTVHPLTMPGALQHRSYHPSSSANRVVSSDVRLPPPNFNPSIPILTSTSVRALANMSQQLNGSTLRPQQPPPPPPPPPPPTHPTGAHGRPHVAETSARPMPLLQTSGSATDPSGVRSTAEGGALPPLPEIARRFETWNLSEFETSLEARQPDPGQAGGMETGVVCLLDDE